MSIAAQEHEATCPGTVTSCLIAYSVLDKGLKLQPTLGLPEFTLYVFEIMYFKLGDTLVVLPSSWPNLKNCWAVLGHE